MRELAANGKREVGNRRDSRNQAFAPNLMSVLCTLQYTAYALPFLLREEQLASSGVDLDSCLHFLFELYAQWMKSPSATETPLTLLTETVRSTLVLSDVFTESGHFR